ncbi:LacI family DNA-binding transcriptional regulator [Pedosphaera parvula]|uniref:Transcriptional regulator, LacI family n=1 Tax=Pedosphaera parvula (strain Ellin514) TaxID=320771 RepID=B9XMS3_PEDPL|nr:LacI family DNA-binding transcriptional regulator [Pedosphaera parvula]EEF58848.1 transcriptional regulator, LacI family [Pedosphaera parvula Ellin514]
MVRLKDIANRAGVSVMTVSKVMRNAPDISAATKARVKVLAQQMGYVPDSTAQSLRTRTSRLLGVVVTSLTDPILSRVLLALEERAYESGFEIILTQTLDREEREEAAIQRLLARRVDGLFISPVYRLKPEAPIYQILQARGTPVVILGNNAPFCRQFVAVGADDLLGGYAATQHLLQLGHKRIAFFTGPHASPWAHERFEGYRRALRETGLDVDDRLVFQAGQTIDDGAKAALQFMNESADATAIQAVNDLVAIGCANTFLDQGVKIPQELSLIGFGNILTSEYFRVPLTTVRQAKFRLGSAAMEVMLKMIGGERGEPKRLKAEIAVRASTGTPRLGPLIPSPAT